MAEGPGKYDELCTYVRETAQAQGVVIIVLGGNKGNGFSCQATALITALLPGLLRYIANQIERPSSEVSKENG
jgi:hypothetical protein